MRPFALTTLAAVALLAPAGASSASSSCGAINGGFENTIRATNVSCTSARTLVRKWHHKAVTQSQGPGTKYVGSYYCHSRGTDPEHVQVACASGSKHVTFFAGP